MLTTRAHARAVRCPKCGATGYSCFRYDRRLRRYSIEAGFRKQLHGERHRLAIAQGAPPTDNLPPWLRPSGGAAALTREGAAAEEDARR